MFYVRVSFVGMEKSIKMDVQKEKRKMAKLSGQGALPDKCPKCKKANLNWTDKVFDESMTKVATCPECNTEFSEYHRVEYWEED